MPKKNEEPPPDDDEADGPTEEEQFRLDALAAQEAANAAVDAILEKGGRVLYEKYLKQRVVPYISHRALRDAVSMVNWLNLVRDSGEPEGPERADNWYADEEPRPVPVDTWASGTIGMRQRASQSRFIPLSSRGGAAGSKDGEPSVAGTARTRRSCTRHRHRHHTPSRSATRHVASPPTDQSARACASASQSACVFSPHVCSSALRSPSACHPTPAATPIPAVAPAYAERRDHQCPPLGIPREPTPPVPGVLCTPRAEPRIGEGRPLVPHFDWYDDLSTPYACARQRCVSDPSHIHRSPA